MSSSETSIPITPTYVAAGRFANDNDNNHAGAIWIATILCLVYSTLVIVTRAHIRWNVFSLDDYIILLATILQTGEVVALVIALQHGLGQSHLVLTKEQLSSANIATFVGTALFIASTCFAKISVILLMMRLFNLSGPRSTTDFRTRVLWFICFATAVVVTLWGVGSIIVLAVNCSIPTFTTAESPTTCPQQMLRWDIIGAIDATTEILLVLLSITIVWPVQLSLSNKIPIVLAFTFRLPCALLSILHAYYMNKYTSTTTTQNPDLTLVAPIVIMQIQLCYSMISATIPNLKSFVRSFNSGFGHGLDPDFISKYGLSSRGSRSTAATLTRRGTGDYEMTPVKTNQNMSGARQNPEREERRKQKENEVRQQQRVIPRRPSRQNVDLNGIGFHAGIPAIPGFGARRYVTRIESVCSPEVVRGSTKRRGHRAGGGESGRRDRSEHEEGSVVSMEGEGESVDADTSDSRELIIRKDMQYEVRYEMV